MKNRKSRSGLWADMVALCRAEPGDLAPWLEEGSGKLAVCLFWLVAGCSIYGLSVGLWRAPLQGFYVALKFPLIVLLTAVANAAINGMLAQLLGSGMTFRQSFLSVIMSFALLAVILGSLAPLSFFLLYNLPPMGSPQTELAHNVTLLFHVALIALAGIGANVRLYGLLARVSAGRAAAARILVAWLAVNMFLGCQVSWNMRPFVGSPGLEVRFVREDALKGSFYESVFRTLTKRITEGR